MTAALYFERLIERYGALACVIVFTIACAVLLVFVLRTQAWARAAALTGLLGFLFAAITLAPRALDGGAFLWSAVASLAGPAPPTGRYNVDRLRVSVEAEAGQTFPIELWLPQRDAGAADLILYAPSWNARGAEMASLAAELASHGFAVMAIDDVSHDLPHDDPLAEEARLSAFDDSSAAATARTNVLGARRAALEVRKLTTAVAALQASRQGDLAARIDFSRIGAIGYSFGGAVATEAALADPRIAAAVNIDGTLFGRAATSPITKPVLAIYSDFAEPTGAQLAGPRAAEHARTAHDLADGRRLAAGPGAHVYHIEGAYHLAFSDAYFHPRWARRWLAAPARVVQRTVRSLVLAFFNCNLRNSGCSVPDQRLPYVRSVRARSPH